MSRSKKPRFRGHTPRSAKLKAIVTALAGCAFAAGSWLVTSDALSTGSIKLHRRGAVHQWSENPIAFAVGVVILALCIAFWGLGAFAALKSIRWRDWRH